MNGFDFHFDLFWMMRHWKPAISFIYWQFLYILSNTFGHLVNIFLSFLHRELTGVWDKMRHLCGFSHQFDHIMAWSPSCVAWWPMAEVSSLQSANSRKRASASREVTRQFSSQSAHEQNWCIWSLFLSAWEWCFDCLALIAFLQVQRWRMMAQHCANKNIIPPLTRFVAAMLTYCFLYWTTHSLINSASK